MWGHAKCAKKDRDRGGGAGQDFCSSNDYGYMAMITITTDIIFYSIFVDIIMFNIFLQECEICGSILSCSAFF